MAKMNWFRISKDARDKQASKEGLPKFIPKRKRNNEKKFQRKLAVNAAKAARRRKSD